jgi:hypothetical protein
MIVVGKAESLLISGAVDDDKAPSSERSAHILKNW